MSVCGFCIRQLSRRAWIFSEATAPLFPVHDNSSARLLVPLTTRCAIGPNTSWRRSLCSTRSRRQSQPRNENLNKTGNATPQASNTPPATTATSLSQDEASEISTPPDEGPVAIIFTDIVKSTNIWEKAPAPAVAEAMKLHDNTIRHLTVANSGFEVKQNGDGFLLAFPSAISAVQCCLDVQEKLLDKDWPREILKLAPGQETTDSEGNLLFRGFKLRISGHWGEPVRQWNEVIQRMDYLGPVVNRAARFLQVTQGGQIVVSEEFLVRLRDEMRASPGEKQEGKCSDDVDGDGNGNGNTGISASENVDFRPADLKTREPTTNQAFRIGKLGVYQFPGLEQPECMYYIVPSSLEGRVDLWEQCGWPVHPGVKETD